MSTSRGIDSEDMLKDGDNGLQPGFGLPREEAEEVEPEREREVVMRGGEGFTSLSRPREAMSSMKDGSELAIWAEMGTGVYRRKGGLGGSRVERGHSYRCGQTLGYAPRLSRTDGRQIHLPL